MIEDIASRVFTKAFFSLASSRLAVRFRGLVAKIAVNACYDQFARDERRSENQTPQYAAEQEDDWLELQMLQAAREAPCQCGAAARGGWTRLNDCWTKLDPEPSGAVLMDRDGYSVSEIQR